MCWRRLKERNRPRRINQTSRAYVVDGHDQPDAALWQSGHEPHAPQRVRAVQRGLQQLGDQPQQGLFRVRRLAVLVPRRQRDLLDVPLDPERGVVDPYRPASQRPGPVYHLTQPGYGDQPAADLRAQPRQAQSCVLVTQRRTVEDEQGAHVHRGIR
jgi:hypothetical protein